MGAVEKVRMAEIINASGLNGAKVLKAVGFPMCERLRSNVGGSIIYYDQDGRRQEAAVTTEGIGKKIPKPIMPIASSVEVTSGRKIYFQYDTGKFHALYIKNRTSIPPQAGWPVPSFLKAQYPLPAKS